MRINNLLLLLMIISFMYHIGCTSSVADGSTTETTNGMMLSIITKEGSPAKGAIAALRPSEYRASIGSIYPINAIQDVVSDSLGIIIFNATPTGGYTIVVHSSDSLTAAINEGVIVVSHTGDRETTLVAIDTLSITGTIAINLPDIVPESISFLGTKFSFEPSNGVMVLGNKFPAGSYQVILNYNKLKSMRIDITVDGGDTTVIDENFIEKYWKKQSFVVNSTSSGILLTNDLSEYPYLLRLSSSSSTDSLILNNQPTPKALIIRDNNGEKCSFKIEKWSASEALIWVEIPLILANNGAQKIDIEYGSSLSDISDYVSEIFSEEKGYIAVFHGDLEDELVVNETILFNDAKGIDLQLSGELIGNALGFNGVTSVVTFSKDNYNILTNTEFTTFQMWIKPNSLSGTLFDLRTIDKAITLKIVSGNPIVAIHGTVESQFTCDQKLSLGDWSHVTVVANFISGVATIYINGVSQILTTNTPLLDFEPLLADSSKLNIGSSLNGDNYFDGLLDEIRIFRGELLEPRVYFDFKTQNN